MRRLLAVVAVLVSALGAGSGTAAQHTPSAKAPEGEVTPASGRSWVSRRGLVMLDASLGRISGFGQTSAAPAPASLPSWPWPVLRDRWVLTGADLYRLDCRSCHGADGTGLPPEINSVLDPARASSAVMLQKRMEERGRPIDARTARGLASQAEGNLRLRLFNGGEKMPALPHLSSPEIEALLAYLGRLAGVPGGAREEVRVTLSAAQVGQHIVKGTCQICHDAAGAGTYSGRNGTGKLIPSLATIVETRSVVDVIRKVHTGSATPEERGEMPLFTYLSEEEIGAAYVYLLMDPPQAEPVR